jgi:UDP-glucose 4-epimerase
MPPWFKRTCETAGEIEEPSMKHGRPVVLLTGASGFVGRHVAPILQDNGWVVRRALRKPSQNADDILIPSIDAATDWRQALTDVEAVVHLAARAHRPNDDPAVDLYRPVNTDGTLQLARCAAQAGISQFVYVSSILVNGGTTDGRVPFHEDDIPQPRGVYGKSKADAESGLQAIAHAHDMRVTVIRPPLVYGSGARGNFGLLVRTVQLGVPLPFASVRNCRAFLAVDNLSSFIVDRLSHANERFDIFLVADQEQISTPELIGRIARAAGTTPRLFPLPTFVLSALFRVGRHAEAYDSVVGSMELDISKALSTGWRPPISLDEGLRLAISVSSSK